MKSSYFLTDWLENHWATPAFGGGLLAVLAVCFFGAATNTMAGWLYALSGVIVALLAWGAILPARSLSQLSVTRLPIASVSAGDDLTLEMSVHNPSRVAKTLLQLWDLTPHVLGKPQQTSIEFILPQGDYRWTYYLSTQRRGIYRWQDVQLRTGSPLGLFWCRRTQTVAAKAIVYPQVLPLTQCPLVDTLGQEDTNTVHSDRRYQAAAEGVTKTLRPYRHGDPTRLIHWRTSARFEEFKVRELEIITGGEEVIICLDSASAWDEDNFERAAIAAASLYFYASHCQHNVKLWTAGTGLIHGSRTVLETLAAVEAQEDSIPIALPSVPLIWLTQNVATLERLPEGSRWVSFVSKTGDAVYPLSTQRFRGLVIDSDQPLPPQLQRPLR